MSLDPAALRFGLGPRPGRAAESSPQAMLAGLAAAVAAPSAADAAARARLAETAAGFREARRALRAGEAEAEEMTDDRRALRRAVAEVQLARLARAATTTHGFAERLEAFWANHFAVGLRAPAHAATAVLHAEDAIRPRLAGRFAAMAEAAILHPAMLVYLDQTVSVGPDSPVGRRTGRGLNENLAREVLELHTLGAGGPYGQADVEALARLLTGFGLRDGVVAWRPRRAQPGRVRLLGRDYDGASEPEARRALADLARHPATGARLARKLAVHFLADDPPERIVRALAHAWAESDGELGFVAEVLLRAPEAEAPLGAKTRQPWELVTAALRAAGAQPRDLAPGARLPPRLTLGGMEELGQPPLRPPGPDGWPEEAAAWITPAGLAARLAWGARLGRRLERDLDPRDFAETALGPALTPATARAIAAASERWEGYALLAASPDFNRR